MCILSDGDILDALASDAVQIEPFDEANLTPNGYDLSISEVMVPGLGETVTRDGVATVPPGARFVVSTREVVGFGPEVCGQLWIRSSYARRGVLVSFGKVEAGFEGTLTIGAFNGSHEPLELPIGDRFCQVVFERMHNVPRALYAERSGTYQGQRGITLPGGRG